MKLKDMKLTINHAKSTRFFGMTISNKLYYGDKLTVYNIQAMIKRIAAKRNISPKEVTV